MRPPVGAVLVLLASASGVGALRAQATRARPPPPEQQVDLPPFPPEVARPFSFGLRSLVSDLAFLEAIQVHGGRKGEAGLAEGAREDRILAQLLGWSTDLDPQFRGAYRFAGNALIRHTPEGRAAGVFATEQILRKGVRERPDDWKIQFMLGFLQSYYLDKKEEAAAHFAAAAALPEAPGYIPLLATRLAADAGNLEFAEQLARAMAAQATEESSRREWEDRLLDLEMERHLRAIEAAQERYRARTGARARTLDQLLSAGELRMLPFEPHGGAYYLDAQGEPRSTARERLRLRERPQNRSGMVPQ